MTFRFVEYSFSLCFTFIFWKLDSKLILDPGLSESSFSLFLDFGIRGHSPSSSGNALLLILLQSPTTR